MQNCTLVSGVSSFLRNLEIINLQNYLYVKVKITYVFILSIAILRMFLNSKKLERPLQGVQAKSYYQ